MVITVTLNPAIDRTVTLDTFSYGSVNRVVSTREDMGGKGINVSKILQGLGIETKALGFIGQENIEHVEKLLNRVHLNTRFVKVDDVTRTNTKVVDASQGETTDLNEAGFTIDETHFSEMTELLKQECAKSDYLVLSGSIPKGLSKDTYQRFAEIAKASTKVILDAEGELLLKGLQSAPFLIKPNIHELEGIIGRTLDTDDAIIESVKALINTYGLEYVLVSRGGDGSILVGRACVYKVDPIRVEVKSTVGAGDSMLAGFVYGLMTYEGDLVEALRYATACGTLAVETEGTQAFGLADIQHILPKVNIHKI